MLQRLQPMIRKLPDPIKPPHRAPFSHAGSGPLSPLERNPQSPKGWKNRESDGVGLGIVAKLGRSDRPKPTETVRYASAPISIGCCTKNNKRAALGGGIFCSSPPLPPMTDDIRGYRTADFLNSCHLCRKKLHGKDIYMYRGEKAFCSTECRYQQIVSDEFREKCGSEVLRSSDASRSSYAGDRLFFTGIAAA